MKLFLDEFIGLSEDCVLDNYMMPLGFSAQNVLGIHQYSHDHVLSITMNILFHNQIGIIITISLRS